MVMTFTKEQTELLNQPIDPKVVAFRQQGNMQLAYLESWYVINEANRIFGFDGWQSETVQLDCVQSDDFCVTYIAKVRVTIGDVIREGVGAGHGKGKSVNVGDKHESAVKEAESDARKRAFMQFGSQFGLSLYDRTKAWKNPKKDRTPVSTQNLTVVAKDAILKADTRERLDKCAESLEVRYASRQIPQNDYNDLCDLIKTRKEVITT
jgi:DNA recombination protein Rad52|tara:strand:- start:272 stop:895 length:624 start_codon:yes stop_codon:yes gene_type:complete